MNLSNHLAPFSSGHYVSRERCGVGRQGRARSAGVTERTASPEAQRPAAKHEGLSRRTRQKKDLGGPLETKAAKTTTR